MNTPRSALEALEGFISWLRRAGGSDAVVEFYNEFETGMYRKLKSVFGEDEIAILNALRDFIKQVVPPDHHLEVDTWDNKQLSISAVNLAAALPEEFDAFIKKRRKDHKI